MARRTRSEGSPSSSPPPEAEARTPAPEEAATPSSEAARPEIPPVPGTPAAGRGRRRGGRKRPSSPERFLNRELTWLEFNRRVLHEAVDDRTPLLERVNFLRIFTSNLDEFVQKRVGGLKRQVAAGVQSQSADGMTPAAQLTAIRDAICPMLHEQARCYRESIKPGLAKQGIHLLEWRELTDREREQAVDWFREELFPVLTPLAVDPGHPFPFISNLSTSLAVLLKYPDRDQTLFARVKAPSVFPQWRELDTGEFQGVTRFVPLIQIIAHCLPDLFPEMEVIDVMPFRLTRNADIERDEEDAEDLLEMVEEELRERRFARVVRLEHSPRPNREILSFLIRELRIEEQDVYEMPELLDYTTLSPVYNVPAPKLKYSPWSPVTPPAFADDEVDAFSRIRESDVLVHHPYESANASVERLVREAADDPAVLAIKMTLYRTGDDSPFIQTLIRAAEAGKQVVALVELKARFDESRNVQLAQALEKAGVHVVYGIVGLKTHTKTTLIVRQDPDRLRSYVHIGTGNYHVGTARLYTDLSLFTCDPRYTREVVELFHFLTGRSLKGRYDTMLVAPVNMKQRFLEMIRREVSHQRAGRPAGIVAKMNSLEDVQICEALYDASDAGVPIHLIVRGFCCLRPGAPGMSENIQVLSIIGRFLEHSRIFHFRNGQEDPVDGDYFLGSADWMYRNLHARVEAIAPVLSRPLRARLHEILEIMLADRRQAWEMGPDGQYTQRNPASNDDAVGTHERLMRLATASAEALRPGAS